MQMKIEEPEPQACEKQSQDLLFDEQNSSSQSQQNKLKEITKNIFKNTNQFRYLSKQCKCHLCGKKLQDHFILKSHLKAVHSIKPYSCKNCQMSFERVKDLKFHIRKEHLGISEQDITLLNSGKKYPTQSLPLQTKKLQKEAQKFMENNDDQQKINNNSQNHNNTNNTNNYKRALRNKSQINFNKLLEEEDSSNKSNKNEKSCSSEFSIEEEMKSQKQTRTRKNKNKSSQQQLYQFKKRIIEQPQYKTEIDIKHHNNIQNQFSLHCNTQNNFSNLSYNTLNNKNESQSIQSNSTASTINKLNITDRKQMNQNSNDDISVGQDLKSKSPCRSIKSEENSNTNQEQQVVVQVVENQVICQYNKFLMQFQVDVKKKSKLKQNKIQKQKQLIDLSHYQNNFMQQSKIIEQIQSNKSQMDILKQQIANNYSNSA